MSSIKKSFFWSAVEQVGPKAVQIIVTIILARLLEPTMFGLMGMLTLFMGLAQVFADCGLSASLIQKQELTADDETSVFAMNIALGIVLTILLCAISPLVARFYKQPVLMPLLCAQSLSVLIASFSIVQRTLLSRAMLFHKTAVVGTISTVVSGITGMGMAYFGFGVWSLVGAALTLNTVQAGLLWRVSDWRPRGLIRLAAVRSIWRFSSYLLYCQLIGIVYQNIYSVVIGRVYSAESLGYYNRANTLRMLPANTMTGVINKVAFPLFSRCQNNKELLLKRIRELVRSSLVLSAAGMTLLAVLADPLVPFLMTEKWMPTVPLLRILCYAAAVYPISALYLVALQAQGHSNLNFRLESIKMVMGIIVITSVYRFGVTALARGVVGTAGISYFLNAWYNVKLLGYRWRSQAFDILPTFALCAGSAFAAWMLGGRIQGHAMIVLLVKSVIFSSSLLAGLWVFRNLFFRDIWRHLTGMLKRIRQ